MCDAADLVHVASVHVGHKLEIYPRHVVYQCSVVQGWFPCHFLLSVVTVDCLICNFGKKQVTRLIQESMKLCGGIVKFQKVKFQSEVLPNCYSSYHHWMSLEADAG